ncbi:HlyD family efflux transporter periplasmic adaptor subunit [Amantichitinum ursilacus]|nr:HlyD family efflux transporter periplasmic adaptor subunit [Amantichitinum ursilacus]
MARPGQMAAATEALAMVVPAGAQMQVELYAPSKSVGFIKTGARVGLRFAAYPYQKFGVQYGHVQSVSRVALTPADVILRAPFSWQSKEAHYRVVIALDKPTVTAYGREETLTAGMAVAGDVALDSRRLYEWALEPLWSLRGKI